LWDMTGIFRSRRLVALEGFGIEIVDQVTIG
jgi:hypothetical protein